MFDTTKMHHATRAKAEKLAGMLAAEYPALTLNPTNDEIDQLNGWQVFHTTPAEDDGEADAVEILSTDKKVPELADIFEACEAMELDPELGADDEEERDSGTVVSDRYKIEYAARGDASNCGDWLARVLPKIEAADWRDLEALFIANGVEMTGKWADLPHSGQRGWFGRYRMNGRQKLQIVVLTRGTIFLHGSEVKADREWLEATLTKHPKVEPVWLD